MRAEEGCIEVTNGTMPAFRLRWLFSLAIAALLAVATYGMAAGNTVPGSLAGDGSGGISGFSASNIDYNLNAADPTHADSVTFTISPAVPAGGQAWVRLNNTGSWYNCSLSSNPNLSCTTPGSPAIGSTNTLQVVAAQ